MCLSNFEQKQTKETKKSSLSAAQQYAVSSIELDKSSRREIETNRIARVMR